MDSDEGRCRSQRKQWLAAFATTLPMITTATMETQFAFTLNALKQLEDVHEWLKALAILFAVIGYMIGAIFGAISADMFGRRKALFATTISSVGGIIGVFPTSPASCCMILLIGGFNSGIAYTVVPLYISEIAEVQIRGRLLMFQLVGVFTGQVIVMSLDPIAGFGIINIGLIIIPILFLIAIWLLHETPYHLISKKQYEAAGKALVFFRGIDQSTAEEELDVIIEEEDSRPQGMYKKMCELFRGNNRKGLIIVTVLIIIQCGRMYFISKYDFAFISLNIKAIKVDSVRIIIQLILVFTIDVVGRRPYLLGSSIVGLVVASLLTLEFMDPSNLFIVPRFIDDICQMIILGVSFVLVGELFSTNVKSIASAAVVIFGSICKIVTLAFDFWLPRELTYSVCCSYILTYLLAFIFVYAVVPETKKKTFAEIQYASAKQNRFRSDMYTTRQYNQSINEPIDDESKF